ncbi:(R,S)-reticuline 7-O-methyltransferase-like [Mercurialis annua]|uniref:(R,S)-reticuline 7-O-methyltransferase-like n=1 Tax=Mercurialis annua TaxID=3986 RepID=UPI0021603546|nr:(R,S)-reticuline 7-O-methyltransferase-like [Mercurialis annua]
MAGSSNQEPTLDDYNEEAMVRGQAELWNCIFGYVQGMALTCIVQLGIPDIINSHGRPLSISSIAEHINHPSLNSDRLSRIMTFLVRKGIFTAKPDPETTTVILYGLTNSSKWLLSNSKTSLAPMALLQTDSITRSSWHFLTDIVKEQEEEGTSAFAKSNGLDLYDFTAVNPEYNGLFSSAMAATSMVTSEAVKRSYKDGFIGINTLVDVAGGTGAMIGEIVKEHPHIQGINFDLPHVVAVAPEYAGVTHVAGDMFTSIPSADAILLKWILHNWNDEECIKILKNCRKAIREKSGKLIIIDAVLRAEGDGLFDDMAFTFDLNMMVICNAKERNEADWKMLLEEGGFPTYKIIKIPALVSIIEAYPH